MELNSGHVSGMLFDSKSFRECQDKDEKQGLVDSKEDNATQLRTIFINSLEQTV